MAVILNDTFAIPGNLFDWEGNHGSAEMSTLSRGHTVEILRRVYDDACDVGFVVRGKRESVYFVMTSTQHDHSGEDIAGWGFASFNPKTGRPDGRFTLLVIND